MNDVATRARVLYQHFDQQGAFVKHVDSKDIPGLKHSAGDLIKELGAPHKEYKQAQNNASPIASRRWQEYEAELARLKLDRCDFIQ